MPLSDFIRQFLQNVQYLGTGVGWTPEQHAAMQLARERQGQAAEHRREFDINQSDWERQQQASQAEARARILAGLVPYGYGEATQQGGPGLNATQPTTAEQPGQVGTPRQPSPALQPGVSNVGLPWLQMFGQQGQTGLGMNTPGQMGGGPTSPSDRLNPTGASSGGGGAVPIANKVMPNPIFNLGNVGGSPLSVSMIKPAEVAESEKTIPYKFTGKEGPGFEQYAGQTKNIPFTFLNDLLKASQPKPPKEDKDAPYMDTAIQDWARKNGVTLPKIGKDEYHTLDEVPPEKRDDVLGRFAELKTPGLSEQRAATAAQRRASELDIENKLHQFATQRANASTLLDQVQKDPKAWFDKTVSKEERDEAKMLAREKGIPIPTRDLEGQRAIMDAYSLDLLANNNKLRKLAAQIGPDNLGAIAGRWNSAEQSWGSPITTKDPKMNKALAEFQDIAKGLTVRETKQQGGGRAAVQLMNTLQNITPQLKMHPDYLAGAFDAVDFQALNTIKDNRDYMMGNLPTSKHVKDDVVTLKGIGRVRLTADPKPDGTLEYEKLKQ